MGFDVQCLPLVEKGAVSANVPIKLHKLIYKFEENLQQLVDEVLAGDSKVKQEKFGTAEVKDIFNVKSGKGGKQHHVVVGGALCKLGYMESKHKFKVTRAGEVVADGLRPESIRKLKIDVAKVNKGEEFGIAFKNFNDIQSGDIIECYREVEVECKFNFAPGVEQSF